MASSRSGSGFLESAATEHVEDVDCPELGRIIQNKDLQMVYCRPKLKDNTLFRLEKFANTMQSFSESK